MPSNSYISGDLLYLILKLLSVKTLLRLRCVCKFWKQLMDSTAFMLDHLSLQTPRFLVQTQQHNFNYILIDPNNPKFYNTFTGPNGILGKSIPFNLRAVSTVHGVICLYDNCSNNLVLYNPSIRRHVIIPLPKFSYDRYSKQQYCGFWIDPFTKQYKVVIFNYSKKTIALYSSKKKEWAKLAIKPCRYANYCQSTQVLIDNVAHWIALTKRFRVYLVYYDFGKEESGRIHLPSEVNDNNNINNVYVSKWRGFLSVVNSNDCDIDIYVMQNGSWNYVSCFRAINNVSKVFCALEIEDFAARVLASTRSGKLAVYDSGKMAGKLVSRQNERSPIRSSDGVFCFSYDFVESFIIPDQTW